jgi:redox-sensitive bicupin YhaK (pirin superfamily)
MTQLAPEENRIGTVRPVARVVRGMPASDGAGVRLTRVIGQPQLPDLDPFLLLDEFRSDQPSDYIGGFPEHPHRGFETVTYMLAGRMRHGDNRGNVGLLRPGSVQWMTAGRGIVHSEMPEQENGLLWGFQLWVNLKASEKMTEPRYQDIEPQAIPVVDRADGVQVRVIAGRFGDAQGPVAAATVDPTYLDIALPAGQSLQHALPRDQVAFAYVFDGAVRIGEHSGSDAGLVYRGDLAVLGAGDSVTLSNESAKASRLLLIAGRPLKEPIVRYGPFVMNTQAQLRQAIEDYRSGQF